MSDVICTIDPSKARRIAGAKLVHCHFGRLGFDDAAIRAAASAIERYGADVLGVHIQDGTMASIMYGMRRE
jgi:hypothetical protein